MAERAPVSPVCPYADNTNFSFDLPPLGSAGRGFLLLPPPKDGVCQARGPKQKRQHDRDPPRQAPPPRAVDGGRHDLDLLLIWRTRDASVKADGVAPELQGLAVLG